MLQNWAQQLLYSERKQELFHEALNLHTKVSRLECSTSSQMPICKSSIYKLWIPYRKALAICCEESLPMHGIWLCKKVQYLLEPWQPSNNNLPLHHMDCEVFIYKSDGYPVWASSLETSTNAYPHATHFVYQAVMCFRCGFPGNDEKQMGPRNIIKFPGTLPSLDV